MKLLKASGYILVLSLVILTAACVDDPRAIEPKREPTLVADTLKEIETVIQGIEEDNKEVTEEVPEEIPEEVTEEVTEEYIEEDYYEEPDYEYFEEEAITYYEEEWEPEQPQVSYGSGLTPQAGVYWYGNQKETYYNLDMSGVISLMGAYGYSYDDYWIREDGCKMLGSYIMVAANLDIYPRGSLVETSLGTGLVCDTGGFAYYEPYQIDIATTW